MAQLQLIKKSDTILVSASSETSEFLQSIKNGDWLHGEFKRVRNILFHKKFFSLLNLGYHYYQPTGGAISPTEKKLVHEFAKYLSQFGGSYKTMQQAADDFLSRVANKRVAYISAVKSFDAFREWAIIEAGYYDNYQMPNGAVFKKAKSISFSKMDNTQFEGVYNAVLNVLWNLILFNTLKDKTQIENVGYQLMGYAA